MVKRTDCGKLEFKEFNQHHWIEVRRLKIFYVYFIVGEQGNTMCRSKFYSDFDDCLYDARMRLDKLLRTGELY